MVVSAIDLDLCRREEKDVVEGLCLSYDLMKGTCAVSGCTCDAVTLTVEKNTESLCEGMVEYRRLI